MPGEWESLLGGLGLGASQALAPAIGARKERKQREQLAKTWNFDPDISQSYIAGEIELPQAITEHQTRRQQSRDVKTAMPKHTFPEGEKQLIMEGKKKSIPKMMERRLQDTRSQVFQKGLPETAEKWQMPYIYPELEKKKEKAAPSYPKWKYQRDLKNRVAKGDKLDPGDQELLDQFEGLQVRLSSLFQQYNVVGNYMMGGDPSSPMAVVLRRQITDLIKNQISEDRDLDTTSKVLLELSAYSEEEIIENLKEFGASYRAKGVDVDFIITQLGLEDQFK